MNNKMIPLAILLLSLTAPVLGQKGATHSNEAPGVVSSSPKVNVIDSRTSLKLEDMAFKPGEDYLVKGTLSVGGGQALEFGKTQNFTVTGSANVTLHAAKSIYFGPGFRVEKGAVFSATVDLGPQKPGLERKEANKPILNAPTEQRMPTAFSLAQNYPNPFNPTTRVDYALPSDERVSIKIFNTLGQIVATLADENQSRGYKSVVFDASALPSGIYFYQLQAGEFRDIRKMVLMK